MSISVGETLDGRYRLTREISRGASTVVFEGQHLLTKRAVAIKLPTARASRHDDGTDRLLVEARLLTEARHPCVVEALDAGKVRSGALSTQTTSYLVMEMLEARPLSGILTSRGQLSVMDALRIALPLCDALASIHRAGVVHGDLRPGNVFIQISRQGPYDPPIRLIDFGAAARALTGGNDEAGTPTGEEAYRSPEQHSGQDASEASDMHALASMLYECLTGKLPFAGPNFVEQMQHPPVPPRELRPDMPADMNEALLRALAFDPAQRFADAAALGRALKTSAVPSTPQPPAVTTSDVPSTQPSLETLEREAEAAGRAALSEPPQIELRVIEVETIPPRAAHTDPSPGMKRVPRGPVRSMPIAPERGGPIPQPLHKPPRHDTRRRFQRASYLTPVRVIRSGGHSFDARCEDISEGGLLLIGPHLIEDAEAIEVRFALPITGDVATVAATSRWVRAAREGRGAIGVEFHGLPAEMRQVIGNYVQFFSYDG